MNENQRDCGCGGHRHHKHEAPASSTAQAGSQTAPGIVPGRKAGNLLGLRAEVSLEGAATGRQGGCGCGCGGH